MPLRVFREDVAAGAKNAGESVELFGRQVRYRCLFQAADGGLVATAHTLSDRAETTFLNLLRGTGLKGLCSIPPVQGTVIRPLIRCTREEIEAYCRENELSYVTDSTNLSADYTRNRVRQTVIPALQAIGPSFYSVYGRMLAHLEQDEAFLEQSAEEAFQKAQRDFGLDAETLLGLHPAVLFRVMRRYFDEWQLSLETVQMQVIEQILRTGRGQAQLGKDFWLELRAGVLCIREDADVLELEPLEGHKGFEWVDRIVGGVVPKEYIPAAQKGVEEAMNNGILGGYPVIGLRVSIVDGSYHDVDSSEMAFKIAGSMAFKEAMRKADPVLMEPIVDVEVVTPEDYMGDVMGDLSSRRGKVEGMGERANARIIKAFVPLAEMFGYATDLRSRTSGRASYSMTFSHYEEVPRDVAEKLLKR